MKCEIRLKMGMQTRSATRRRRSNRNPLSDCTNTHASQQSSSSSVASTSVKHFTSSPPTIVSAAKLAQPQKSTAAAAAAALSWSCKENGFYASSSNSLPHRGLNPSTSVHAYNKHRKLKTNTSAIEGKSTSTFKPSRGLDVSSSVPAFNKHQVPIIQRSTRNENIASTSTPSHGLHLSSSVSAFNEPKKYPTLRSTIKENIVSASISTTDSRAPNPLSTIPGTINEQTLTSYRRRQSADKRNGTCDPVALPNFSCPDAPNQLEETTKVRVTNQYTSTKPTQKKQCLKPHKEVKDHSLTQDFILKQKAYFAEIDAFELSEEEVASIDELD